MKKFKHFLTFTFKRWKTDDALSQGAALSFYTIIAFPALILSVLFLAGIFLGKDTVQTELLYQAQLFFGNQGSGIIQQIISNVPSPDQLKIASMISILALLWGAMGFFEQLQIALNKIWDISPKELGWKEIIKNKLKILFMVLCFGGLLVATLIFEFLLSFLLPYFQSILPLSLEVIQPLGLVLGFVVMVFVFAFVYRYIPHVKIAWKDVFIGAIITTILFSLGKYLIGFYLSRSNLGNIYGATGSLVIFLVWIYYSSQVVFLGAEFTQSYANLYGSKIKPDDKARHTDSLWKRIFHKF